MTSDPAVDEFLRHRARLLGIAYRLLGSMWDAEDVVSEAMVRWLRVDQSEIREPVAFLTTMVSRIALDQLKSARVKRQDYIGPWLPEPALTASADLGPLDTVELRESVSVATLHVMEQLTPPERGVFVLREAFDFPFAQIADILDIAETSARQHYHRAQQRLADGTKRFDADPEEHATLLDRFLRAVSTGELEELEQLLATDAVVYTDGGGKRRAALRAVVGSANIIKFLRSVLKRGALRPNYTFIEANAQPAVIVEIDDHPELITIDVRDHRIRAIYGISNPDKLSYLDHQLANRA